MPTRLWGQMSGASPRCHSLHMESKNEIWSLTHTWSPLLTSACRSVPGPEPRCDIVIACDLDDDALRQAPIASPSHSREKWVCCGSRTHLRSRLLSGAAAPWNPLCLTPDTTLPINFSFCQHSVRNHLTLTTCWPRTLTKPADPKRPGVNSNEILPIAL